MPDNPALRWKHVEFTVRHGFWMTPRVILEDLDLSLPQGTVLGLVGPNGAGKTTTIKLGAGLLKPTAGQVEIYGVPAIESRARRGIGLLTETQYVYPHLRLGEWLAMMAGFSGLTGQNRKQRVLEVLEQLELTDQSDQMMRTLSKGQTQRAGLAQALVHKPGILLLDEPMSGLDPYWRLRIQKILRDFKTDRGTILFSSHIIADVERLSDRIALLDRGKLRWTGRLSDLQRNVKGYEVLCGSEKPDLLTPYAIDGKLIHQPDGKWLFSIATGRKADILNLGHTKAITLESLRPMLEEIEEVLFGFISGSRNKAQE